MIGSRALLAAVALGAAGFTLIAVAHAPARRLASTHDHTAHAHPLREPGSVPAATRFARTGAFAGRAGIEAAFPDESYRPGDTARLRLWRRVPGSASLQVFHVGRKRVATFGDDEMRGTPVGPSTRVTGLRAGRELQVPIGDWPTGLYFAQLTAPGRVGFAPFVVAPRRLGENRVAVVLPTRTWQAYNLRDDDGNGVPDTWYTVPGLDRVQLGRPFEHRGVPPHFRTYDLGFLQWLHDTGRGVDVLAQEDLDEATGAELAAGYDLMVFPGHHEYVTEAEYDAVTGFRDQGGNLMFLSANNFFWRIDVRDGVMTRVAQWRKLGRPEAALLGVQYVASDSGVSRAPWQVRPSAPPWLFAGVELGPGRTFSRAGIEIDAVAPSSPRGTRVVASIPDLLGPGLSAHMTYYETPKGARVFSAGAFTLAGSIRQPAVRMLLTNVWERLARAVKTPSGLRRMTPEENRRPAPPGALRGLAHLLPQYPALELARPLERAESARLLAEMVRAARPWVDPRAAARDGFDIRRPKRERGDDRVMWFHSEQRRSRRDDAYFDPRRPDTLIYADMPGYPLSLVGFMFSMPRGLEGGSPGGPITRWHWHVVCANAHTRGTKPPGDGSCPPGTRLYGGSEMLHVWFTGELRSAYAIHAPVPELCKAKLVPPAGCKLGRHEHGM